MIICFISSFGVEISDTEKRFFKPSMINGFKILGQQEPKNSLDNPKWIKLKRCGIILELQSRWKTLIFLDGSSIFSINFSKIKYNNDKSK